MLDEQSIKGILTSLVFMGVVLLVFFRWLSSESSEDYERRVAEERRAKAEWEATCARSRRQIEKVERESLTLHVEAEDTVLTEERLAAGELYAIIVHDAWEFRELVVDGTPLRHFRKARPAEASEPIYYFGYRGEGHIISVSFLRTAGCSTSRPARMVIRPMTTAERATWEAVEEREARGTPTRSGAQLTPPAPTPKKTHEEFLDGLSQHITRRAKVLAVRYEALQSAEDLFAQAGLSPDKIEEALTELRASLGEDGDDGNGTTL